MPIISHASCAPIFSLTVRNVVCRYDLRRWNLLCKTLFRTLYLSPRWDTLSSKSSLFASKLGIVFYHRNVLKNGHAMEYILCPTIFYVILIRQNIFHFSHSFSFSLSFAKLKELLFFEDC